MQKNTDIYEIICMLLITGLVESRNNSLSLFGIVHCHTDRINESNDGNRRICVCNYQKRICGVTTRESAVRENITMDVVYVPTTCSSVSDLRQMFPTRIVPLPVWYVERLSPCLCSCTDTIDLSDDWIPEIGYRDRVRVITSVIQNLKWSNFVFIYDYTTAYVSDLITDELSLEGVSHIRYEFDTIWSSQNLHQILQNLYDKLLTPGLNVTVFCRNDCAQNMINEVDMFDKINEHKHKTVMNQKSRWLIISSISSYEKQCLASNISNLDNILLLNMKPVEKEGTDSDRVAYELKERLWKRLEHLFAIVKHNDQPLINQDGIKNITNEDLECEIYNLQTLMWSGEGRRFNKIGYVTNTGDLHMRDSYYPNEKFGFNGRKFLVTTNHYPPFVITEVRNNVTIYRGFCMDLLDELARQLNFTYDLTEPVDREWGKEGENGTWTGMIGQLQNEEVDLMVAPTSLHPGREMVMDFTYPFYFDSSTFMMRRPDSNQNKWLSLISPLRWQVLVSIAVVLPVCAALLSRFEQYDPNGLRSADPKNGFHFIFWYMFGALLQEGGYLPNLTYKGRIMISFWWIFSIIIVATYSGNLVAFLTVTKSDPPFNTFDELASQTRYKWSVLEGTIFLTMFKTSPLQTFQVLWQGLERESAANKDFLNPDPDVHVERILTEDYVLIECKSYMEFKSATDCRLLIAEEEIPNMSFAVGLPNNSPFTEIFSNKILELHESGILQIIKEQNWPKRNMCKDSTKTNAKAISLIDLQSAFYLLAVGAFVAFTLLLLEYLSRRLGFLYRCLNDRCT